MYDIESFYGPNAGYVLDLYERYLQDPSTIDRETRAVFDSWLQDSQNGHSTTDTHPSVRIETEHEHVERVDVSSRLRHFQTPEAQSATGGETVVPQISQIVAASELALAIRVRGHLGAHLDPLGSEPLGDPALLAETHGLTDEDLAQLPPMVVGGHAAEGAVNALEAIQTLHDMYSGTISYEFDQVKSSAERQWLRDAVGLRLYHSMPNPIEARKLLKRITQIEAFERYLHQTFPGQKRFSIEGTDALIPMLDEIIHAAIDSESRELIIGMAHRGRLNVLAHILEKPYGAILTEFGHAKREEGVPLTDTFGFGWTGDVKYHLGAEYVLGEGTSHVNLKIVLSPNPSHLEFVNPVIEGMTRAAQELRSVTGTPLLDVDHTLPILIHGDSAFPGEGVVSETMNLWQLRGYWVGGTIHIIANNQLGFTTGPEDSRSTHFASDVAKGFEIPIIHANADDPYACLTAVRIAHAYRDNFHKDVLVDLVGYRRWGHNEGDEPAFTQPQMYDIIRSHPTVRELFARRLEQEGIVPKEEADAMLKEAYVVLEQAKRDADSGVFQTDPEQHVEANGHVTEIETAPPVSVDALTRWNAEMLTWPENFSPNPKLERTLQRRASALGPEGGIDWGQAEALAFASILSDGTPVRLTGQDSERGTFSHRHAVLHSQDHEERYVPLQHLSDARASFSIYNSPLSESGVLGFEYGYSVHAPDSLVLWEAQFGDFANVAQVILDQFIASGHAKWKQASALVLLLPHGYEGQGPEHSSARLERYLQLAAEDNLQVVNCSTSAQYFHLLRRQAYNLHRHPRPLVVMTPKSLLRNPLSSSRLDDLVHGTFQTVVDDEKARSHAKDIQRVVLCTGKISIELVAQQQKEATPDIALVRVEQLYPFPEQALKRMLSLYSNAQEIVWVQEEPRNMGAWSYIAPRLTALVGENIRVISRPDRASPATGFWDWYIAEQEQIIADATHIEVSQRGGKYVH